MRSSKGMEQRTTRSRGIGTFHRIPHRLCMAVLATLVGLGLTISAEAAVCIVPDGALAGMSGSDNGTTRIKAGESASAVIPAGDDCFTTKCGRTQTEFCSNPIPPDFFGPGSDPFDGAIRLGSSQPGSPDTVVRRLDNMVLSNPGDTATIPIELVQLSLVSCEPIIVRINGGDTSWDVQVSLSSVQPPLGHMTATKTHDNGGTFTAEFYVQPLFIFTRQGSGDMRFLDTGAMGMPPIVLDVVGDGAWVHNSSLPHFGCGVNFVPGVEQNPATLEECCTETCHTNPAGGHMHCVKQCQVCRTGACCDPATHTCTVVDGATMCLGEYKGDGTNCNDSDADGLSDWVEFNDCCRPSSPCNWASSPINPDTDGGGVSDGTEVATGCDPCVTDCSEIQKFCVYLVDCRNPLNPLNPSACAGCLDCGDRCMLDPCVDTCPGDYSSLCGPDCCLFFTLLGCQFTTPLPVCPTQGPCGCRIPGACCDASGGCTAADNECNCDGTFLPGRVCGPTGACCLPDGSCTEMNQTCCEEVFNGIFEGGTCDPPQECCFTDGSCMDMDPECCMLRGGFPGPGLCDPPQRCCLPGGSCIDTDPDCCILVFGGLPVGGQCEPEQKCCLPDGSCMNTDPACCVALYNGIPGVGLCEIQKCCLGDGSCIDTDPFCCEFILNGTSYPNLCRPEACCLADGTCVERDRDCCLEQGDRPWAGPCQPLEACCFPPMNVCMMLDPRCCEVLGGAKQGAGSDCLPTGACCIDADGDGISEMCVDDMPEECCDDAPGGTFQGGGSTCSVGVGACCYDGDGDGFNEACAVVSETCCDDLPGGRFEGVGTACGPIFACCFDSNNNGINDTCKDMAQECCNDLGGLWGGALCAGATGACCWDSGGSGDYPDSCEVMDALCCADLGGTFHGAGTDCGPVGACCWDGPAFPGINENCAAVIPQVCCPEYPSGTFQGGGTICAATVPCCFDSDGNGTNDSCVTMSIACCNDIPGYEAVTQCLGDGNGNGVDDACEQLPDVCPLPPAPAIPYCQALQTVDCAAPGTNETCLPRVVQAAAGGGVEVQVCDCFAPGGCGAVDIQADLLCCPGDCPPPPPGNVCQVHVNGSPTWQDCVPIASLTTGDSVTCDCAPACPPVDPVTAPAGQAGFSKNRYISFVPGNPSVETAIHVRLADLPPPFEGDEGCTLWVAHPADISEVAGSLTLPPTFKLSRLQAAPHCMDWSTEGVVHVADDEIVPNARYEVQVIDCRCDTADEANYSTALSISTSRWGDLVGGNNAQPPNGVVDFNDVSGIVDKFKNMAGAPIKSRTDVAPDVPNRIVDFVDIPGVVDAFRGRPYPYDGPDACP